MVWWEERGGVVVGGERWCSGRREVVWRMRWYSGGGEVVWWEETGSVVGERGGGGGGERWCGGRERW